MKPISHFFTPVRVFSVAALCFALTSCGGGSKVKGTYSADGGIEYNFDGSNVVEKVAGVSAPSLPYTVDGDKVTIKNSAAMPGAPDETLTINSDGSLEMKGLKLVKK